MINWIKYDPANPPKLYENYLILTPQGIISARLDKNLYFEILVWTANIPLAIPALITKNVTHYAHINLPGEETDNA